MTFTLVRNLTLTLLTALAVRAGDVVINEIMYYPPFEQPENPRQEWIELFNRGASPVNLRGWQFTRGVSFTFSGDQVLAPGGYLVVAADVAAFSALYPAVPNVVGGWTGQLANGGEQIELQDASGQVQSQVTYSDGGDWAVRLRGSGEDRLWSLTSTGATAYATVLGHFGNNDQVLVSGADQPEYNGVFGVFSVQNSGFRYSVFGGPSTPATGVIVCRQLTDFGRVGWSWSSRADGLGSSLELINPWMPNQHGQNWQSSPLVGGTPGQPNSALADNIAPLILEVQHQPLVPRSIDPITITARILDEQPAGVTVNLVWRIDTAENANEFVALPMFDDGEHNDGPAGDGIYGAALPAQTNNTVIEFYVAASDLDGRTRTWPAPALDENSLPIQQANALLQVDDSVYTGSQPIYRIIMREAERAELQTYPSVAPNSDARMNATFIAVEPNGEAAVRYLGGIRDRGAGSRYGQPANYRLNLPSDRPWRGIAAFNFNINYIHSQYAGYTLANLSGLNTEAARIVQVRVNNVNRATSQTRNFGSYIQLEASDGEYAASHFPADPDGDVYRGSTGNHSATLDYIGTNFARYANAGYSKQNNGAANNWNDLINLTYTLSTTPDADYAWRMREVADVEEWMTYFSVYTLTLSRETSFATGRGDDFSMFFGVNDPRGLLLAHDWDTILNEGDTRPGTFTDSIFRMCPAVDSSANTVQLNRFMRHPEFAPLYYRELKRLADTVFSPAQVGPTLDQALGDWVPQDIVNRMKTFSSNRTAYVLSQIPLALTVKTLPSVTLTSPTNGAVYGTPVNINLAATATDSIGISRVAFYQGATQLGQDTTSPYTYAWNGVAAGNYLLSAVATDVQGLTTTSAIVSITVTSAPSDTLIASNSVWKYLDDGSDQGTDWTARNFNDSSWHSGPAQLGYGDGDEATVVSYGPNQNSKYITTYFRRSFVVTNKDAYASLNLWLLRDDGGVVYLNGTEIYRSSTMPGGTIAYNTLAPGNGENTVDQASLSASLLVNGTNVIAVEIHQQAVDSSDISFDFNLAAVLGTVTVSQSLVASNSVWKYLDNGTDQGAAWTAVGFNDGSWSSGPAQLGYGDGDEATVVSYGPDANNKYVTTYFRRAFVVSNPSAFSALNLWLVRDDGGVVYLNGVEVFRSPNMPAGPIAFNTLTVGNAPPDNTVDQSAVSPSLLVAGTNVIAVEIHQQALNSSDMSFEFALTGIVSGAAPPPGFPDTPPDTAAAPATGTIALGGRANVIETRSVRVNGEAAEWTGWQGLWRGQATLDPGMNRIWVQAFGTNNQEIASTYLDFYYSTGTSQAVSGAVSGAVTWRAADGPFYVSGSLTVGDGATLTIEPGTAVYFAPGTGLTVSGTGRLLAEGTDHRPIRLTRQPGSSGTWAGITLDGATGETRLSYVDIQYAGSSGRCIQATDSVLYLDHATFTNVNAQYLTLDHSSFQVRNSVFPSLSGAELIHGVGLPAGGYGIIEGNTFGTTTGLNDIIDFTGGKRPGAILQILNNTFTAASDDILDLDGTDAHIEGNIFMRAHQATPGGDTSSAISGGKDGADNSDLVIVRNIFYDCDHAVLAKEGNFYVLENNTLVHMTVSAVNFNEPLRNLEPGFGAALRGNIVWDTPVLFENYTSAVMQVTVDRSIIPTNFPGTGNLQADPRLLNLNSNAITYRTITNDFRLRVGSPAIGSGPNGLDMGALVPAGASIAGEPSSPTPLTSATLTVAGPGITHYRWSLNHGVYSGETPVDTPIVLTGLASGDYTVSAIGKNDAGVWQDTARATISKPWTVNPALSRLVLNEVLARNITAVSIGGRYPDLIEIRNAGGATANLNGMGLTDDPSLPFKFTFPPGTTLSSGGYLVVEAGNPAGSPYLVTGFGLNFDGDGLYLYSATGQLVDSVAFGAQPADFSIGRLADGTWSLTQPTLGSANVPVGVGDPSQLRINEWLAAPSGPSSEDFIELYNRDSVPVALGGLWLTDNPIGWPAQSRIAPLSFVEPRGFSVFLPDANPAAGSNHVSFRLSSDRGTIALLTSNLAVIDQVVYPPQTLGISQGRYPDGLSNIVFLSTPTPGAPNPGPGPTPIVTNIVARLFGVTNQVWRYEASGTDLGTTWRTRTYNDSGWPQGRGLFGFETTPAVYPYPFNTRINAPRDGGPNTAYFRTHFAWTNTDPGYILYLTNYLDDGAVFYLNGVEVGRIRIDTGTVTYNTYAANQGSEGQAEVLPVPGTNLVVGDNVLAVELHQGDATSSDDVFGLALTAIKFITNTIPPRVVINEVLANNASYTNADGTLTDWIELFNPSTNATDLSDMSLSDDTQDPRRWVFPNGVVLPPGGYLVVRFDPDSPPSTNNEAALNTGFGLNAGSGDQVHLFDTEAHSRAPLDRVVFGIQAPDFSVGRIANGSGAWTLTLPTRASVNLAAVLGSADFLRINEWMANPNGGDDWFELFNPDTAPVALGGLYLTDDLADRAKSLIPALSFIAPAPNGYLEFHADNNSGANHVNVKLSGSGEALGLYKPGGFAIDSIVFGAQANGVSEGRFPDGTTNIVRFPGTDTPGASNLLPIEGIVVNEVLTHTDLPLEDAIELQNLTASAIDVSGWYLTDNKNIPRKYRLPPGSIIEANGYLAFYEYQFNPFFTGIPPGFALSGAQGDEVYLFRADASGNLLGYRAGVTFGAAENGISFGRFETSVGVDFTALTRPTFGALVEAGDPTNQIALFRTGRGALNAYPKVGPVVINEIMYHPPDIAGTNDDVLSEYIELLNITGNPVPLYDPAFPGNPWRLRDAVDFDFPAGTAIPAGGFLLVVSFDPATNAPALASFRAKYGLSSAVPIVGPYDGKLANNNDSVELDKPDHPLPPEDPDAGYVPRVLVDKVKYSDSTPWPTNADGAGQSLQRLAAAFYGNDPVNWVAANPTPGAANGAAVIAPPVVTQQPASASVRPGTNVTFTVAATGAEPLGYQWRFNGSDVAGATNASLTLANVQRLAAGRYTVRVTNPGGAALSSAAVLTLQEPPVIERAPESGVAAVGGSFLFSVLASGTPPLGYQWQHAATNLAGATNSVLLVTNAQTPSEGLYRVRVANAYGAVTSAVASLTLNAAPAILVPPANLTVYQGSTAVFSVVAGGSPPLRYQWRFNGVTLNGATNATLTVSNAQAADAGPYSVRVANGLGSATSPDAVLTVAAAPVVTVIATDPSASEPGADTGAFTLHRTGNTTLPLTVTFQIGGNAAPGSDYLAISSPVTFGSGVASRTLSVVPLDDPVREGDETVVLTLLSGPSYVVGSPSNATVTIRDDDNRAPFVTLTNPPDGERFTAPVNVLLGAAAGDPDGVVARVEFFDGTNRLGEATSAPFEFTWTNAPAGTHVLTALATDNLGATGVSAPVTISINAPPVVNILRPANGATFVAPATFTVSAAATAAEASITLVEFYQGTELVGVDATLPYTVTVRDLPAGTYAFAARATDSRGAVAFSPAITVTVVPPLPNFADNFAQRGMVSGFTNTVRGTNTTFTREPGEPYHDNKAGTHSAWLSWIAPAAGPVTLDTFGSEFDTVLAVYTNNPPSVPSLNTLVPLTSNDDATNGSFQSELTFNAVAGAAYQIAVDGWDQTEYGLIVFHISQPNLNPVIVVQPQSQVVNQGANVTFGVTAAGPGPLAYQWRFNGGDIPGATRTNLTLANAQPIHQGLYSVAVINGNGTVSSLPAALTVRVPPAITVPPQSVVVDPGSNATFSVTVSGSAPFTYQWRFNGVNLSGATDPTYTRVNAQPAQAGGYSVVVGNGAGSVTSQSAELTVRPKIVSVLMTNGWAVLTLQGTPGRAYAVEMRPDLTGSATWQTLGTVSNAVVESQFLDTTVNGSTQRVYRLRLMP